MRFSTFAASALMALPAHAELTYDQAMAAYRRAGVAYDDTTSRIDERWISDVQSHFDGRGMKGYEGALTGLRTGLAGAEIHSLGYSREGYSADLVVKDGEVVLAHFYLPIFSLTASAAPENYVEIATELASQMTDGAVSPVAFEAVIEDAIEEAHAAHERRSTQPFPGYIFASGASYNYSAWALVPEVVTLTVTRFPQCPFNHPRQGWLLQHVCAQAK